MKEISHIIAYPDFKNFVGLLTNSSSENKEVINPLGFFAPSDEKSPDFNKGEFLEHAFKGQRVRIPFFEILDEKIEKHNRFEEYTSRNEVQHIATWLLSAIQYLNTGSVRVGKELEIVQHSNPRDGRLDVAALRGVKTISIETKTDLKSLLGENRFVSQIAGYTKECVKLNQEYLGSSDASVILAIGGEETDIYPPGHIECTTGEVGGVSELFYKKIFGNNIKFISANAVWTLFAYSHLSGKEVDLFDTMDILLNRNGAVGLLSAGLVVNSANGLNIESLEV